MPSTHRTNTCAAQRPFAWQHRGQGTNTLDPRGYQCLSKSQRQPCQCYPCCASTSRSSSHTFLRRFRFFYGRFTLVEKRRVGALGLSDTQRKYSTYDREVLTNYSANKYFKHMLEARHFLILTDHKPITYDFFSKTRKSFTTLISLP